MKSTKRWRFDWNLVFCYDNESSMAFECSPEGKIRETDLNPLAYHNLQLAKQLKRLGCRVFIRRTSILNDEVVGERPWTEVQAKSASYKAPKWSSIPWAHTMTEDKLVKPGDPAIALTLEGAVN